MTATDIFRQDATFHVKNDGWAGSGSVSFQSYNFPARYIRHYSYGLQIDEVSAGSSNSLKQGRKFLRNGDSACGADVSEGDIRRRLCQPGLGRQC